MSIAKKACSLLLCCAFLCGMAVYADVAPADADVQQTVLMDNSDVQGDPYTAPGGWSTATPASAAVAPQISAKSTVLMDATTGVMLFGANEHAKVAPASIAKIMTLLLVGEALDSGKIKITDMVTTSEHAKSMGGSTALLDTNEKMSVGDMLKATAVASANDASVALAEFVAGSEESFVAQMNERASQLGMKDTRYVNCSGLDAPDQLTSAYDVAVVSRELTRHAVLTKYTSIWMDSLRGGQFKLVNTNKMVRFYDGCIGVKTGTTSQAGCCLSAAAARGGTTLIAVVMGAPSSDDRFNGARKLLDYGFANWVTVPMPLADKDFTPVKVVRGVAPFVTVRAGKLGGLLVPKGQEKSIQKTVKLPGEVAAPVAKNQVLGSVSFTLDGKEIGKVAVYAAADVEKMSFGFAFKRLLDNFLHL